MLYTPCYIFEYSAISTPHLDRKIFFMRGWVRLSKKPGLPITGSLAKSPHDSAWDHCGASKTISNSFWFFLTCSVLQSSSPWQLKLQLRCQSIDHRPLVPFCLSLSIPSTSYVDTPLPTPPDSSSLLSLNGTWNIRPFYVICICLKMFSCRKKRNNCFVKVLSS